MTEVFGQRTRRQNQHEMNKYGYGVGSRMDPHDLESWRNVVIIDAIGTLEKM